MAGGGVSVGAVGRRVWVSPGLDQSGLPRFRARVSVFGGWPPRFLDEQRIDAPRHTCIIRDRENGQTTIRKKLTLTIDEEVYDGCRAMGAESVRETEALEWTDSTFGDVCNEEG